MVSSWKRIVAIRVLAAASCAADFSLRTHQKKEPFGSFFFAPIFRSGL
jgi:hypothetical protein